MRTERNRDRDDRGGRDRDRGDDDRGGRGRERGDRDGRSRDRDSRSSERGAKGGGSARRGASYRNPDNVRRRTEQTAGNFDTIFKSGVEQWYPKPGENAMRILPASWPDAEHYGYDVFVHAYIGSSGSTYICPDKTFGKPCAACDEAKELKAAGEDEASKSMAAKKKTIVYVLDRDERKPTPRVWVMSWNQDKEIQDGAIIKRTNTTLYLDDENEGWDLYIKRTGKGLNTRYSYVIDRDPSPIDEDSRTQDDILAYIDENPIPDLLKYADNETIAKALDGGTREKDRDLDDDNRSRSRGRDRDDDDRSPPRRGRDRDGDDEDRDSDRDQRGGRGRGRAGGDDEEDTRSTRGDRLSGRGRDEERPRGRGRDDDDGEESDNRRSRGRDEASEDREERPARGGRGRDEERGGRDREDEDRPRRRESREEVDRDSRRSRDDEDDRPRRR